VFDVENTLVVPDLTPEEYTQLSRRKKVNGGGYREENGDGDSLELMLMDSLQEEEGISKEPSVSQLQITRGGQKQEEAQHTGVDSVQKDQSIYLALESIGFDSWKHFVDTILHTVGDVGSKEGKKKKKKKKTPGKVTLSDVLNGNSPYYHPRFSRAYQKIRKNLRHDAIQVRDIQTLQYHSALSLSWSDLTAEEHSWYLMHQHQQLSGAEARRFSQLKRRIEQEKLKYMEEVKAHAEQYAARYEHMTERQNAQLFADDERRRGRIHALFPQSLLSRVDCIASEFTDDTFEFVSVLHKEGKPLDMRTLEQGYSLAGDKHYLPAVMPLNQSHGIYKKKETLEIHEDEIVKTLLKTHPDLSRAGIVMVATGGAFRALVAADCMGSRSRELEIPITVDKFVWYLGKPLMEKTMMAREKQARVEKYAVLSAAVSDTMHQRQAVYSLWKHKSTGVNCIVRSHATILCSGEPSVLSVKPEYLPLPDREDFTMEEVAQWSADLCLEHPCGTRHMQVAHICVPRGKILSWSKLRLDQIQQMYPAMKQSVRYTAHGGMECGSATLASLFSYALGSKKNRRNNRKTLLGKAYTSGCAWEIYSSTGEPQEIVYDVHSAHRTSTSPDVLASPWIPPIWRPYSDSIAQVPYTFPPYCVENGSDVSVPKRRRVRQGPWRGDLDNPNNPQQPPRGSNDYMEQYLQELE